MKRYILLERGNGEGCDYTIGCNQRWTIFEAASEEKAIKHVIGEKPTKADDYEDNLRPYLEREDLLLVNDEGKVIDLMPIVRKYEQEYKAFEAEAQKLKTEAKERADFERLSKKFAK
jgi:hypothetical protein